MVSTTGTYAAVRPAASTTRHAATKSSPAPPTSSLRWMPSRPASANSFQSSRSKGPSSAAGAAGGCQPPPQPAAEMPGVAGGSSELLQALGRRLVAEDLPGQLADGILLFAV